jgi:hypothetical protein
VDQQTISLIVTGTVAVVAGLGGASLTSFINRKNTKDTLNAARLTSEEQWERTQEREHSAWVRGEKQEAYVEFLTTVDAVFKPPLADAPRDFWTPELKVRSTFNRLKLVGSTDAISRAHQIKLCATQAITHNDNRQLLHEFPNAKHLEALNEAASKNIVQYSGLVEDFIDAARIELGTEISPVPEPSVRP